MQSKDMDNSDEEWENAYVALDPIFQLGWGSKRGLHMGGVFS